MKFRLNLVLIIALLISGVSTPFSVADDSLGNTSETDNYASLNGSVSPKQGFQAGLTNYLGGNNDFTVSAWLMPADTVTSNTASIFIKVNMVDYRIVGGYYSAIFNSGGTWKSELSTGIAPRIGEWQYISYVKSGNTLSFYLNGNLVYQLNDSTNVPTSLTNTSSYTAIGSDPWDGSVNQATPQINSFSGGIDEVKVWTTARTQSEIQTEMRTKVASNSTGLASYWDFNGAATSTIYDRTGLMNLTAYGTPAPTYPDVKTSTVNGIRTVLTFPRTYLNGVGGWKVPANIPAIDLLAVGGGGGAGNNVGAGGAGGGGYYATNVGVSAGNLISIKVGYGGAGGRYSAAGSKTYDGTDLMNGQPGDSSSVTVGATTYLGGGGGGGHTYWATNLCGGSGTPSTWSIAGTNSGSGGTGSTGGLGGAPSVTQSTANGANGFTNSITGSSVYYGSGGGAGGGWSGTVAGVGANLKGGNGSASTFGANGASLSGSGGGGGTSGCANGGYGGSGVVIISMTAISTSTSTLSSAAFRTSNALVATVNFLGKVTFYSQGKRIAGCIGVTTIGSGPYTATCNWKPSMRGAVAVTAVFIPSTSPGTSASLNWGTVFVTKRSSSR